MTGTLVPGSAATEAVVESLERHAVRRGIIRYYEETQAFYDLFWTEARTRSMNYGLWSPTTFTRRRAFENQNRTIASALRMTASDVVLEAGCGTGGTTVWLAATYGARGVGITLCQNQVERATRIAARRGVGRQTHFLVMDFMHTAFRDGTFTKIFASESACYAPSKTAFLREAHRLLRPGGRIVVIDGFLAPRRLESAEERLLAECSRGWAVPGLATVEEFAGGLVAAGFHDLAFSECTPTIMPSARRIWGRAVLALPFARVLHAGGALSKGQLAHVRASIQQLPVLRRGLAIYGIFSATR
jgi:cyclopropane fatty-acyl-phospholipid synthase-like methyltransferase